MEMDGARGASGENPPPPHEELLDAMARDDAQQGTVVL